LFACLGFVLNLSTTESLARSKKASIRIQRIALIGPEDPAKYVLVGTSASLNFPYVVGQIAEDKRKTEFDRAMRERNLHLGLELRAEFRKMLEAAGFEVIDVAIPHESGELIDPDDMTAVNADAVLDAAIFAEMVGYMDDVFGPDSFGPAVGAEVHLFSAKSGKTLVKKLLGYSLRVRDKSFSADERHVFKSEEEVLANADRAIEGLRSVLPWIAEETLRLMKDEGISAASQASEGAAQN
jgi:hypothetical protein